MEKSLLGHLQPSEKNYKQFAGVHIIIGIDCPFHLLVLEFPQNPAEELLGGVGEGLWSCDCALAGSFVGELAKAHPFTPAVQCLPRNLCKAFHKRC